MLLTPRGQIVLPDHPRAERGMVMLGGGDCRCLYVIRAWRECLNSHGSIFEVPEAFRAGLHEAGRRRFWRQDQRAPKQAEGLERLRQALRSKISDVMRAVSARIQEVSVTCDHVILAGELGEPEGIIWTEHIYGKKYRPVVYKSRCVVRSSWLALNRASRSTIYYKGRWLLVLDERPEAGQVLALVRGRGYAARAECIMLGPAARKARWGG